MQPDIKKLLPHREPFLFAGDIVSCTPKSVIATYTFGDRKASVSRYVPAPLLLESMVQSAGAGVRLLGVASGVFALARIENAVFSGSAQYGQQIRFEIANIRLSEKIITQSGIGFIDNNEVLSAVWISVKIG